MTLTEAKRWYGATHYHADEHGVPWMVYRQLTEPVNDGTTRTYWAYLSYANIWMGSSMQAEHIAKLLPIED